MNNYINNLEFSEWQMSTDANLVETHITAEIQRWYRETKGIDITAIPSTYKGLYFYEIYIQSKEDKIVSEDYKTYEEALTAGIIKACELI